MTSNPGGSPTGRVFDIQRFSIHDGPGIRTTVFLKGCPLTCAWCHNPESRAAAPQLAFSPSLCIGCGFCFRQCTQGAHATGDTGHTLDRERCVACLACAEECHSGALEVIGAERTVEDVLREALRDRPFYEESGGGVTVSGGEPLAQPAFAAALLQGCREAGVHTCIETSGEAPWEAVESVLPHTDLFLYDWKETDPERHAVFTGRDNARILDNLRRLDASGAAIVLRCPVIPGMNLRDDHIEGIAELARSLKGCRAVQVMGYHRLGGGKRDRIGLGPDPRMPEGITDMTPEETRIVAERIRAFGTPCPVTA
jgi:glycyl-radical enzyme activating protein